MEMDGCHKPDRAATPEVIAKFQSLLGSDVLYLPWPLGTKGTKRKWKNFTSAKMSDPSYLKRFTTKNINIGVAQGTVSNGLCSIDIDVDDEVEGFVALNPTLATSLRTKAARGCNIWFRVPRDPPDTKKITTNGGRKWGELRGNGSQTIIHGKHPSGCEYRLIIEKPPVGIAVKDIRWPDHVLNPFSKNGSNALIDPSCTEETDGTEVTNDTQVTDVSQEIVDGAACRFTGVEDGVNFALPRQKHSNHDHLFLLARAIKTLEKQQSHPFSSDERREIFGLWYDKSKPHLREHQSKEAYMIEFLNAYKAAKSPIGAADSEAWNNALRNPLPINFLPHFAQSEIRLVIGFCVELQRNAGDAPFFLSCRTLQKFLHHNTHTTSASWLRALVADEVLDEVEKGNAGTGKASRYKLTVSAESKLDSLGHTPSPRADSAKYHPEKVGRKSRSQYPHAAKN
jgi:Bifunctional DNA primase/polymerase, N-terminal